MLFDSARICRTFSDIDTSEGAFPYEQKTGGIDYVEYIARSALAAGAGRSGPIGGSEGAQFEARGLVRHAVRWIEEEFVSTVP